MKKLIIALLIFNSSIAYSQDILISTQPVSLVECFDNSADIYINAESKTGKKLFYQWFKDKMQINGEVFPVLKFTSLSHNNSGTYYCRVFDEEKSDSSDSRTVSLYVLRPTAVSKQPEDVISCLNNEIVNLNFEAHINGNGINEAIQKGEFINIQWFRIIDNLNTKLFDDEIFKGVNSNKLSINTAYLPDTTFFCAEIEGKCGKAITKNVKVIKNLKLLNITIAGLDACEGNVESIKSVLENPNNYALEFKWYKDGKLLYYKESIKGVFSEQLTFNPIFMNDSGKYKLEVKIKDLNYKIFSNEVDVKVGKKPKIVCVRVDTLFAFEPNPFYRKNNLVSWLNIFYEYNNLPTQFDIYCNGKLVDTKYSIDSEYNFGNLYFLEYLYERNDSLVFWVIAHNKCGYDYSDTVKINRQTICDPFNQFNEICNKDSIEVYLNYKEKEPVNQLKFMWTTYGTFGGIGAIVPVDNEYVKAYINKFEMQNYEFGSDTENDFVTAKYNLRYEVKRALSDSQWKYESEFCCFNFKVHFIPKILKQHQDKIINYGFKDTLFYIYFNNEFRKKIDVELYFVATLNHKPRLIDKSVPEYGRWYSYIKNTTFADDGYYYALVRYDNPCKPVVTDTVKITIIPKVSTGISEFESRSNQLIYPNPASDYITISIPELNKGLQPLIQKVQIFNILGVKVISTPASPGEENLSIDISHLPAGVYYVKLGGLVEKFVKM